MSKYRCKVCGKFIDPFDDFSKFDKKGVPLCEYCDIEYPEDNQKSPQSKGHGGKDV